MNLYHISQTQNTEYDTFDSAIVAAETSEIARHIVPNGNTFDAAYNAWCDSPGMVTVVLIGEATPKTLRGVVLSSFNAG